MSHSFPSRARWRPVTKKAPCPACHHTDWCAFSPDGNTLRCMRPDESHPPSDMTDAGPDKGGGRLFRYQTQGGVTSAATRKKGKPSPPRPESSSSLASSNSVSISGQPTVKDRPTTTALDWNHEARRCGAALSPEAGRALALRLGVSVDALETLGPGWATYDDLKKFGASGKNWRGAFPRGAYVFPETDSAGQVVGLSLRTEDGRQGSPSGEKGARRGVVVSSSFASSSGLVLVVEGASDVAALLTLGLMGVGRPSNVGGVDDLASLLPDHEVLVVGENDKKPTNKWPGREGAIAVASGLAREWGRPVSWCMPPAGFKDVREYLKTKVASGLDLSDSAACKAAGAELLRLLQQSAASVGARAEDTFDTSGPYRETPHGLVWDNPSEHGVRETPLTTFTARIIEDVARDDGAETRHHFRIRARVGHRPAAVFDVAAEQFATMNWAIENLGVGAIVMPGQGRKDHARAAIQYLSRHDATQKTVYTHLGWRKLLGTDWVFLHANGGIGANGVVGDVEVEPPNGLERYVLPAVPQGDVLKAAVRASLNLLVMSPSRLCVPLGCATYRSVISACDFALHVCGSTGSLKSSTVAVFLSHFGSDFSYKTLPAAWSSTSNAIEAMAFAAMNLPLVIDDFAPNGTASDIQRLHATAERVFRGAGNQQGRARLNADTSLRATKYPRGLIISTGEEVPNGHSVRARTFLVDVRRDDVSKSILSTVQKLASEGVYAQAMSAYLAWLAPRLDQERAWLRGRAPQLRDKIVNTGHHLRTPGIVADLYAGLELFARFAADVGALEDHEAKSLLAKVWEDLLEVADAQASHHGDADPVRRFQTLLSSLLGSGAAFVASAATSIKSPEDRIPPNPAAWGWRPYAHDQWQPMGECIGWTDGMSLYLNADAAHRMANRHAGDVPLGISAKTLSKRLSERGLLQSRGGEDHLSVQITLDDSRRRVLHLRAGWLSESVKSEQAEQHPHSDAPDAAFAPLACTDSGGGDAPIGAEDRSRILDGGSETPLPRRNAPAAPITPILKGTPAKAASALPDQPGRPCRACRGHRFWAAASGDGGWTCERCHPPAAGDVVSVEIQGSTHA